MIQIDDCFFAISEAIDNHQSQRPKWTRPKVLKQLVVTNDQ